MNRPPFLIAALTNSPQLLFSTKQTGQLASGQVGAPTFPSAERLNLAYQNVSNTNTAGVFIQYFDAAAANQVTLGTTVPLASFYIPGTQSGGGSGVLSESYDPGIMMSFKNGCVVAATSTQQGGASPGSSVSYMGQFL